MKFKFFKVDISNRVANIVSAIIFGTAFILVASGLLFSISKAKRSVSTLKSKAFEDIAGLEGWNNPVQQELWKEKIWLENQLTLEKEDSMSLGINLIDSLIQLQFKGLVLVESKVKYKIPKDFLSDINSMVYQHFFGNADIIVSENSNIAKKPVKKVRIDSEGNTFPIDSSASINRNLYWEFVTEKNIRFVLYGYTNIDSIEIKPVFRRDIRKFRFSKKARSEDKKILTPVVFIWLDNDEAKAIYRALPYKATIIVKN